jgi:hypothetical protein
MSNGNTLTLSLPTTTTLKLEELIQATGYSKIVYAAAGFSDIASDFGITVASCELILAFDENSQEFKVYSASAAAGRVPLAMTSPLSAIFLSSTSSSFSVTLTTDSQPICSVVVPEPGQCIFEYNSAKHFFS